MGRAGKKRFGPCTCGRASGAGQAAATRFRLSGGRGRGKVLSDRITEEPFTTQNRNQPLMKFEVERWSREQQYGSREGFFGFNMYV